MCLPPSTRHEPHEGKEHVLETVDFPGTLSCAWRTLSNCHEQNEEGIEWMWLIRTWGFSEDMDTSFESIHTFLWIKALTQFKKENLNIPRKPIGFAVVYSLNCSWLQSPT